MRYLDSLMDDLPLRDLGLKPRGASQFASGDQTSKRYFFFGCCGNSHVRDDDVSRLIKPDRG